MKHKDHPSEKKNTPQKVILIVLNVFNDCLQLMLVLIYCRDILEIFQIYAMFSFFCRHLFHFLFWKVSKYVAQSVSLLVRRLLKFILHSWSCSEGFLCCFWF